VGPPRERRALGGNPLSAAGPARRALPAGWLAAALGLAACGGPAPYRNYDLPAALAPAAPARSDREDPVALRYRDAVQLGGGIRMVLPERAAPAPPFALRDAGGVLHTNASLRGRVVWIDLWATWCVTCRAEFPQIQRIHERLAAGGLTVLAVCRNSTREGFEAAALKAWLSFPLVDASHTDGFPIPYAAFPTSVVLDRTGRVRAYWQGHRDAAAVESLLRKLLAESGPSEESDVPPLASTAARPIFPTSAAVVAAELRLPREAVPAGEVFEGQLVLHLDPGWYVAAGTAENAVPLDLALDGGDGIVAIDWLRPLPERLTIAGAARDVYSGRVELPLWGVVGEDAPGHPIAVRLAATLQACDSTKCLLPAEIVLMGEIPVLARAEEGPVGGS
jgi:thiol-disulfide isomerase/thioredoxin